MEYKVQEIDFGIQTDKWIEKMSKIRSFKAISIAVSPGMSYNRILYSISRSDLIKLKQKKE